MKGEKDALWEPLPNTLKGDKKDMNANEILSKHGITMKVGTGADEGQSKKAPAYVHPTTEVDVENKPMEKGPFEKELKGAYAGEMGGKGRKEKLSPMAQKVGKPRKGY